MARGLRRSPLPNPPHPPLLLGGALLGPPAPPAPGASRTHHPLPFPPLGDPGGQTPLRGSILFIINDNIGGDSLAPRFLRPLGGLRPPRAFDPSGTSIPPPTGGITSSLSSSSASSLSQCVSPPPSISETEVSGDSGAGSPAFSASRRFFSEVSRRLAFLALFAFFASLAFFYSSFRARFLARSSLSSGTGGRESLTIPIPYKRMTIKAKARKKGNERKIGDKNNSLPEKCNLSRVASAPPENPSDLSV